MRTGPIEEHVENLSNCVSGPFTVVTGPGKPVQTWHRLLLTYYWYCRAEQARYVT